MQQIAINRSPSAFILSEVATQLVLDRSGAISRLPGSIRKEQRPLLLPSGLVMGRDDPILISIIVELGSRANGPHSDIEIISIPESDDWSIEDVCGIEFVMAVGKAWPPKRE